MLLVAQWEISYGSDVPCGASAWEGSMQQLLKTWALPNTRAQEVSKQEAEVNREDRQKSHQNITMTDKLGAAMRLYLHANQINPALSATLSELKEAINTQEQKEEEHI